MTIIQQLAHRATLLSPDYRLLLASDPWSRHLLQKLLLALVTCASNLHDIARASGHPFLPGHVQMALSVQLI